VYHFLVMQISWIYIHSELECYVRRNMNYEKVKNIKCYEMFLVQCQLGHRHKQHLHQERRILQRDGHSTSLIIVFQH
jgi:hypothetical protein